MKRLGKPLFPPKVGNCMESIYFASVLSRLVTMDLSRFVQVEYSLINNEHKLDTLTITT